MNNRTLLYLSALLILLGASTTALADVPQRINVQGILLDSNGDPVTITSSVVFAIWDAETDGDSLWSALRVVTPDDEGRFNIQLGQLVPIPLTVFEYPDRWLSIKVDIDPEMSPRMRLTSVAYAYQVSYADEAGHAVDADNAGHADEAGHAADADNAVYADSTDAITDGGIDFADIGQNDATHGQVMKWDVDHWTAANDEIGISGGWIDDGTFVRLETSTDEVGIGTSSPRGPLHIDRNIDINDGSSFAARRAPLIVDDGDPGGECILIDDDQIEQADGAQTLFINFNSGGNVSIAEGGGNVGVGTVSPSEKLEVDGNIKATGTIQSGSSIVINGATDQITATGGTIDFDDENIVTTGKATIGPNNANIGTDAFVAGSNNSVTNDYASIGGGSGNEASGVFSTIAGGLGNESNGEFSSVGGGRYNMAQGEYSVIAGGGGDFAVDSNSAMGDFSFIGGGTHNIADGDTTAIVGGSYNYAGGLGSTVGGGFNNRATHNYTTIGGGYQNSASGEQSTVSGGGIDTAGGYRATVSGGWHNVASAEYSTVGGGRENIASGTHAIVGGGTYNKARASYSVVGGGGGTSETDSNSATGQTSTIGGGRRNVADGQFSTVGGGNSNEATAYSATVSGGQLNEAADFGATIPGGESNYAAGSYSFAAGIHAKTYDNFCTVGGGASNQAGLDDGNALVQVYATVSGGRDNLAGGSGSTVGGGRHNMARGDYSLIAGGGGALEADSNSASGDYAVIGGGSTNSAANDYATIAGGQDGYVSQSHGTICGGKGNRVEGQYSCIPGGEEDTVTGDYALAFGYGVYNPYNEGVIFYDGDNSGHLYVNRDRRDEGLLVIMQPLRVGTNTTNGNGAYLTPGGVWTNGSSRTFKENFQPLDSEELLAKIAALPVESWNYKGTNERHIGPVSEDFVAAFDVGASAADGGRDNKYISHGDVAGVALLGVQELTKKLAEKTKQAEQLESRVAQLESIIQKLIAERR